MAQIRGPGPISVKLTVDENGWRTYAIKWQVQVDYLSEGPYAALNCPGLALPGTPWLFLGEVDIWAWCRPDAEVAPHGVGDGEPAEFYVVTQKFSTRPPDFSRGGCQDETFDDPLLEPQRVSGGYTKYTEEGVYDRFGNRIVTSSHEQIRGQQNEWDAGNDTVTVEQNVALLQLDVCTALKHAVNELPLWGMAARTIKLSDFSWEKKWHGQCYPYYTRKFTFEIKAEGWDRNLLDEGTKVLNGHWEPSTKTWVLDTVNGDPPDPRNPAHFIRFKDYYGENARVILDGSGHPAGVRNSLSAATTLIIETAIANDTDLPAPLATPDTPQKLTIQITDEDKSIKFGLITLKGYDKKGEFQTEDVEIGQFGSCPYITKFVFSGLSSIDGLSRMFAFSGNGAGDTVKVTTTPGTPQAGYVRVEKYNDGNFLVLGIPLLL